MLKVAVVTLIRDVNPTDEQIPVLVLCPSQYEKQLFASADFSGYCFHCLEYPGLQITPPKLKGQVDLVAFCQDAIAYARHRQIRAVYYSFDITNLVAAVVCQTLDLFGPRIEGVLNCFHKFYAREIDESSVAFEADTKDNVDSSYLRYGIVQLENRQGAVIEKSILDRLRFPLFVKPVCSSYGLFCAKVDEPEQLQQICENIANSYKFWWEVYQGFFQEFVDAQKYPLAVTSRVPLLVEEMISGQPLTCDGFIYKGQVHFLGLVDTVEAQDGSVDCYAFPSRVSPAQEKAIYKQVTNFIRDSGLDNSFFSAEFWLQERGSPITIEMNSRMSATFGFLYQQSLNFKLPEAALTLAQGICPPIPQQTRVEPKPTSIRLYLSTRKSGLASTLFDFSLARQTLDCSQLMTFNCEPMEEIKDTHYHLNPLAELNLVGTNRAALQFYGEHLRNALLLERRLPTYQITVVQECVLQGGEGLYYDSRHNQLFCLDYGNPRLIQLCLTTDTVQQFSLPSSFYGLAVLPKGTVVLSGESGLMELNLKTQELVPIVQEYQGKQLVCNDVVVDANGCIWFNTIHEDATGIREKGSLLRRNPQGKIQEIFRGLGYGNGMGISPDGKLLYVVDSLERAVYVFALNCSPTEATPEEVQVHDKFIVARENEGIPDGLTVDRAGRLWVTFWFGGKIICIEPRSRTRVREISLPVMNISSASIVDSQSGSSAKLFACSSVVPWQGGEFLAPDYASDLPVEQQGYIFEIDVE